MEPRRGRGPELKAVGDGSVFSNGSASPDSPVEPDCPARMTFAAFSGREGRAAPDVSIFPRLLSEKSRQTAPPLLAAWPA